MKKTFKKMLALVLTVMMVLSCTTLTAFADEINYDGVYGSGMGYDTYDTTVNYVQPDNYIVAVPMEMSVYDEADVYVVENNIDEQKDIIVSIVNLDEDGGFNLYNVYDNEETVRALVTLNETQFPTDGKLDIAIFDAFSTEDDKVPFGTILDVQSGVTPKAGQYTGTLTFAVSCV